MFQIINNYYENHLSNLHSNLSLNLIPHRQSGNLSVYLPTGNFNRLHFKDTLMLGIPVIFFKAPSPRSYMFLKLHSLFS